MGTPAEEFGPYVVYEQLGLGGMATVHRAETKGIAGFSKQVALKRMLPSVANDASLVKSFIREARLASHLRHANVAQTYDLGKVGDTYFIAMELVPGRNLREILKHCAAVTGPMPLHISLNIISQICDALDYAHNLADETGAPLGIIHRDVSPSNIIVGEGGVVKLIDFGIAKANARTGMNTMSGTIKGKFGYMAPEYLMGSIDTRADLWAVGVIAHELLANRPLFQGKDDMDTLYRVKDMPILPPSRINPKVPPELDSVIMTALERDPEQRWQRANALRQALATEIKRLGLIALDNQVIDWVETAFAGTTKPASKNKSIFDEDSAPVISISEGTAELPRDQALSALAGGARGTPHRSPAREVPDEFSSSDGMETLVKPVGKAANEWAVQTETTTPASPAVNAMERPIGGITADDGDWKGTSELPTKISRKSTPLPVASPDPHLIDTRRDRSGTAADPHLVDTRRSAADKRLSSPHVIQRDRSGGISKTPTPPNTNQIVSEDEITLSPDGRRSDRQSNPPPRADRASQPPALAPKADAQARTLMIDQAEHAMAKAYVDPLQPTMLAEDATRSPPAPGFALAAAPHARKSEREMSPPMPSTPAPRSSLAADQGISPVQVRTIPGAGVPAAQALSPAAIAKAALDDLAARGERPAAKKLLGDANPSSQSSLAGTRVDSAKRSGASNLLLALLVLIAAGGAAAVVYFVLPLLT